MCTTGPHTPQSHTTQTPLRRCRVVLTLCSDCVCGDPVRLVWLCVPLDHTHLNHTQHKPHCVGVKWYLHSVAIACAVTQFAWFGCVYHWTTHNTNPLRRCRVVLTLCSHCVCGDPVRLVWLCVPLDHTHLNHTQHKPHCVGVEWYLHSVAIACAVIQFAWFGCVYHWTTHNTNPIA